MSRFLALASDFLFYIKILIFLFEVLFPSHPAERALGPAWFTHSFPFLRGVFCTHLDGTDSHHLASQAIINDVDIFILQLVLQINF